MTSLYPLRVYARFDAAPAVGTTPNATMSFAQKLQAKVSQSSHDEKSPEKVLKDFIAVRPPGWNLSWLFLNRCS